MEDHWTFCAGEVLGFENLVFSIFEFVHTLLDNNKFKSTVRKALPELIYYIILYMQITEDQVCLVFFVCMCFTKICYLIDCVLLISNHVGSKYRLKCGQPIRSSLLRMKMMTPSHILFEYLLKIYCW